VVHLELATWNALPVTDGLSVDCDEVVLQQFITLSVDRDEVALIRPSVTGRAFQAGRPGAAKLGGPCRTSHVPLALAGRRQRTPDQRPV